jgi:hypothetical protein
MTILLSITTMQRPLDCDIFFTEIDSADCIVVRRKELKMNLHISPGDVGHELPPLHPDDDPVLNLRGILAERFIFGVRPSAGDMAHIVERGYASYFLRVARMSRRLGGQTFKRLRDKGRLDLTSEYVLFHHFRDQLDGDIRRQIATLLAESVSHPLARWESRKNT